MPNQRMQTTEFELMSYKWQSFAGEIDHQFDNLIAPAIKQSYPLTTPTEQAAPYSNQFENGCVVIAPNSYQVMHRRNFAAQSLANSQALIREAADAPKMRLFQWTPEITQLNRTQLFIPVYLTYFHDRKGKKRFVIINGRTGVLEATPVLSLYKTMIRPFLGFLFSLLLLTGVFSTPNLPIKNPQIAQIIQAVGIIGSPYLAFYAFRALSKGSYFLSTAHEKPLEL